MPDQELADKINDVVEDSEILFWNRLFHKIGIPDPVKILTGPVRLALSEAMHEAAVAALQQAGLISTHKEQFTVGQLELACRGLPGEMPVTVTIDLHEKFEVYATDFDVANGEFDILARKRKT